MKLTWRQLQVLRDIDARGTVDIRRQIEEYRQRAIDLGMMEPPLVDIEADRLTLTDAGREALKATPCPAAPTSPATSGLRL